MVIDARNRAVPGVNVTFSVVRGGGTITGESQVTDAKGIATLGSWRLGWNFGVNQVTALAGNLVVHFEINGFAPDEGIVAFDVADPAGDTMAHSDTLPPAIDILRLRGDFKRDSLILTMTFAAPVRPSNAQAPNSIGGEIEMDMDDDALTGRPPDSNMFGASAVIGVDYLIDLFDAFPVLLLVQSRLGITHARVSYPGNSIVIRLPLSMLGDDDGNFALASVVGPYVWASDLFPNTGQLVVRRDPGGMTSSIVERSLMLKPHQERRIDWKPRLPGWH